MIDFSRHVDAILSIDPEARTARIEPGVIMSSLQKAAAPHGLRFGPDPRPRTARRSAG
ncbi:FAD-binding protein [Oerskovia sp. M15]